MNLTLSQITNILQSNKSSIKCPGLFRGKMGVAIYFFLYADYTKNNMYVNDAYELIEAIQEEIHENTSRDYANGLAGIGCGLEYLAQQKYIDIHTDEVLQEIDSHIFHTIIFREYVDTSLHTGLIGLGRYLLFRLSNPESYPQNVNTLTNRMLIIHIVDKLEQLLLSGTEKTNELYQFLLQIDQRGYYPFKVKKIDNLFPGKGIHKK